MAWKKDKNIENEESSFCPELWKWSINYASLESANGGGMCTGGSALICQMKRKLGPRGLWAKRARQTDVLLALVYSYLLTYATYISTITKIDQVN